MTGLCWALAGWWALALGMARHHEAVWGAPAQPAALRTWRLAGSAALLAATAVTVYGEGWAFGLPTAFGALFSSGVIAVWVLARAPRACPWGSVLALTAGCWLIL